MSNAIAAPDMMTSAAMDVATIGSNVSAAQMAAAAPTLAVLPAAADEVSASIAHLFSRHAANYQALAAQAAAFQEQFVQNLTASAGSYARTEAANTSLLHSLNVTSNSLVSTGGANPARSTPAAVTFGLPGVVVGFLILGLLFGSLLFPPLLIDVALVLLLAYGLSLY
jgi:hypothetical protein